jgi:hypothetical protein
VPGAAGRKIAEPSRAYSTVIEQQSLDESSMVYVISTSPEPPADATFPAAGASLFATWNISVSVGVPVSPSHGVMRTTTFGSSEAPMSASVFHVKEPFMPDGFVGKESSGSLIPVQFLKLEPASVE